MKKKGSIFIIGIVFVVLGFLIGIFVGSISSTENNILSNGFMAPSLCYTSLQPSSYFQTWPQMTNEGVEILKPNENDELDIINLQPTGSMRPAITDNDKVIVKIVKSINEIKVGDIIQFKTAGEYTLHRVVEIGPDGRFATKGDNNEINDAEWVEFNQIRSKVVGVLY